MRCQKIRKRDQELTFGFQKKILLSKPITARLVEHSKPATTQKQPKRTLRPTSLLLGKISKCNLLLVKSSLTLFLFPNRENVQGFAIVSGVTWTREVVWGVRFVCQNASAFFFHSFHPYEVRFVSRMCGCVGGPKNEKL